MSGALKRKGPEDRKTVRRWPSVRKGTWRENKPADALISDFKSPGL